MQFSWCCLTLHSSISFQICICNTTCSRKSGKKPGCPCRDANLNCCKECLCGKKTHGSIVRPCTNGKVCRIDSYYSILCISDQVLRNHLRLGGGHNTQTNFSLIKGALPENKKGTPLFIAKYFLESFH